MRLSILPALLGPTWFLLPTSLAAAGEPVLVALQITDGAVSAEALRADLAAELGRPVMRPAELAGGTSAETLIVEVDTRTAVLAFQPHEGTVRWRKIDLPADAPGRRKTITWLAQNLVKDQVADVPEPATVEAAPPAPVSAAPGPPLEPPPPIVPPAAGPDADLPAVATKVEAPAESRASWTLAVSGGLSMHLVRPGGHEGQIEAQRSMGTWIAGLALDLGEDETPLAGFAGFVGQGWQRGVWRLEGTAGLGLELTTRLAGRTEQTYSGESGSSTISYRSTELRPRAYGRGNVTLVWRGLRSVDLMLRLALHLETDDPWYSYGSALLGLRVRLL
jgi:hypothetical protein